ncbi:GNAT family N-acetyltransferase [uncultured Ruminococcus sp.]|uniref:GNAT family N-acetyltransferase n=1 Tax=uncultured Ruminococcus sp. TaxID=165186 RepID=UPI0025D64216|nr:GNAT family N-acetyltransferase [uncultured Ruminococcus sp.]
MAVLRLKKAVPEDAAYITAMQYVAFTPLYEKYHDAISPVFETVENVAEKIADSDYYIVCCGEEQVGAVRVAEGSERDYYRISPIFILPDHQNKCLGTKVMEMTFAEYPNALGWSLATIKEEKRNCHFYEKLGFVPTGEEKRVNENMTLVFYEKTV